MIPNNKRRSIFSISLCFFWAVFLIYEASAQYIEKGRKNTAIITKSDLCRNMDVLIENLFQGNGFPSYRSILDPSGKQKYLSPYHDRYDLHLNKGHRALVNYHNSLVQNSTQSIQTQDVRDYYVDLLTAPFQQKKQMQQRGTNFLPNPARLYLRSAPSVMESRSDFDDEPLDKNTAGYLLPQVPHVPEIPDQLPVLPLLQTYPKQESTPIPENPAPIEEPSEPPPSLPVKQVASESVLRSPIQMLYDQGSRALEQRSYSKARTTFETVLNHSPDSAFTQFAYGLSAFYSGDYTEALWGMQKSYDLAQRQNIPAIALWQTPIHAKDFLSHYNKLVRYVEQNPNNQATKELLFLLTQAGCTIALR